jgi:hypothetical protein
MFYLCSINKNHIMSQRNWQSIKNYQDIKFRYEMETDPEMRAWSEEIENQFSNGSDT